MANGFRISINIAATIVILLATAPAVSALMTEISVENLTRESDVIVIGDVKEVESRFNLREATIYTRTILSVEKYIKGTGLETLTIITEGGSKWGFSVWVEDEPIFAENEKVLVFLKKAGDEFSVAGLAQGKYIIKNKEVRDLSGEKMPLNDFLLRVEKVLSITDSISGHPKVDAAVYERLAEGATSLRVIITLKDQPKTGLGIDVTSLNETARAVLIEEMKNETSRMQAGFVEFIQSRGAIVIDRFWLINGLTADVPADLIPVIASMDEVLYIQLSATDIPPPDTISPNTSPQNAVPSAAPENPKAPGFEITLGLLELLAVRHMLMRSQ